MIAESPGLIPPALPGFEKINRYWDREFKLPAAKILPGEYYVTRQNEVVTTVLGSCVAACIRDRRMGVGGMNHFMLPFSESGEGWGNLSNVTSNSYRYGNFAMEHLINDILKQGGSRRNLEIKIFGGGKIISKMGDVGKRNIDFVHDYLVTEGLPIVGEDTGDIYPRKVVYFPATGRVRMKKLRDMHNDTILRREEAYKHDLEVVPVEGSVELF